MEDIHINWSGPFSLDQVLTLRNEYDYGLYQYYGGHPVYGQNVLLYIGSATKQSFGKRLSQHNYDIWSSSVVQIYLGKLYNDVPLEINLARQRICLAESILLFSHSPAFNSSNLNCMKDITRDVRVLNWGKRNSLLPEVSISRWDGGLTVGHNIPNSLRQVSFITS